METVRMMIFGEPRTKKNSQQIIQVKRGGRSVPVPIPSAQYKQYEKDCIMQIAGSKRLHINEPVNICCHYYMATRRRVDLSNLEEATDDMLVAAGVLVDDNCTIVAGHDGSRVFWDKEYPRVEIEITPIAWAWDYPQTHAVQTSINMGGIKP